jgi:hypothetical protein
MKQENIISKKGLYILAFLVVFSSFVFIIGIYLPEFDFYIFEIRFTKWDVLYIFSILIPVIFFIFIDKKSLRYKTLLVCALIFIMFLGSFFGKLASQHKDEWVSTHSIAKDMK